MISRHHIRQVYYAFKIDELKAWYLHRGITDSDLIIGCYMRSGSTWLQNMLYEILTGELPDHDKMRRVMPLVGTHKDDTPRLLPNNGRIIKTHIIFKKYYKKAIYLVRDPRRVAISEYKFKLLYGEYKKTFDTFIDEYVTNRGHGKGRWDNHFLTWHNAAKAGKCDVLFLRFEDMRSDTLGTLKKVIEFLDIKKSDKELEDIIEHNTIKNMQKREDKSERKNKYKREDLRVVNEGKVGDWSSELTGQQNKKIIDSFRDVIEILDYDI